jgi:hypothetical protein
MLNAHRIRSLVNSSRGDAPDLLNPLGIEAAPAREAAKKSNKPTINTLRLPSRSEALPPKSKKPLDAIA